ncbi:MAG: LysR family transcriptional regulator [Henriciella sp.]|nr:LysR family transcriptional regulator [Henriciella sp.]
MNLRQLQALTAYIEEGSVNSAARKLNTAQPNVTRLLKNLETSLGVSLFDRSARILTPTPSALAIYRRATSILSEVSAAKNDVRDLTNKRQEVVRLNVAPVALPELVPNALMNSQLSLDDVEIRFSGNTESGPYERIEQLISGACDIVVTLEDTASVRPDLKARRILELELEIVASQNHPALELENPSFGELMQYQWILISRGGQVAAPLVDTFARMGEKPPPNALLVSNREVINSLLAKGEYLTIILEHPACRNALETKSPRLQIDELQATVPLILVTRAGYEPGPAANRLITEICRLGA